MKKVTTFLLLFVTLGMYAEGKADFGNAKWIGTTADANSADAGQSVWLRTTFQCYKPIKEAILNICGMGAYELYLNNQKVGNGVLSPAWSDYNKTVFYNRYDMTELLHAKALFRDETVERRAVNMIYVMLGNGFYHEQGNRYHKLTTNNGPLTLLFNLDITYNDGTKESISSSDQTWFVRNSPVTFNSIYGGEDYDARLEDAAQTEAKYQWRPAVVQSAPKGTLRMQKAELNTIVEKYNVVKKLAGHVYDMGQNVGGFPYFTITGKRDAQVKIIVGETLGSDGKIDQSKTGSVHYYTYTLRGKKKTPFGDEFTDVMKNEDSECWHPHFSYYGFRYIQIEGAVLKGESNPNGLPVIEDLKSCAVSNGAEKYGRFECSNPLFAQSYQIINRSLRSNWMSIWTNNPNRDKIGTLAQTWLNGGGILDNFDAKSMIEQELMVLSDAQQANGNVPSVAPLYAQDLTGTYKDSPEWGGAIIALPYLYAERNGDKSLMEQYKPQMKRYIDYLSSKAKNYIISDGMGDWNDVGATAGTCKNTQVALVSTAHYYLLAKMMGLNELANNIKQSFITSCTPNSQAGYAIALVMGLYQDGGKKALLDKLIADIHAHKDRLTTGSVGTGYLFEALLDNDQAELLYTLLDHYETPGYGIQTDSGTGTLTDNWDAAQATSRNNFALGQLNNFLIRDMVGIQVKNGEIEIYPRFIGNLMWAKGATRTPDGEVKVSWKIQNGTFILDVNTPNQAKTKVNNEALNRMCIQRNLKLQCNVRGK